MKQCRKILIWILVVFMVFGNVMLSFAENVIPGDKSAGEPTQTQSINPESNTSGGEEGNGNGDSDQNDKGTVAPVEKSTKNVQKSAEAEGAASAGSFVLTAINGSDIIIKPIKVNYDKGDTVKSALAESGYSLEGLDKGFITAIEGSANDAWLRFYDDNGWDMDKAADKITAMVFTTKGDIYSENYISLVKILESYTHFDSQKKNYSAIKTAYDNGLKALPTANSSKAMELVAAFNTACKAYEDWQNEPKYSAVLRPMQAEKNVAATVEVTDSMGNSESLEGAACQFNLRAGTYDFKVTKDINETTGSFTVSESAAVDIEVDLAYENYIDSVSFYDNSTKKQYKVVKKSDSKSTVYIPDNVLNPYWSVAENKSAEFSGGIDNYRIYKDYTAAYFGTYYGDETKTSNGDKFNATSRGFTQPMLYGIGTKELKAKVVYKDSKGYTQRQYYTIEMVKYPTLSGLTVAENGAKLALDFDDMTNEYDVTTVADELEISASCLQTSTYGDYGLYKDGYNIVVNGDTQMPEGGSVTVPVAAGSSTINIVAQGNNEENVYKINVKKVDATKVTLTKDKGVSVELINAAGSSVKSTSETDTEVVFNVAPGSYTWIATLDEYYHTKGTLTVSSTNITKALIKPEKVQYITDLSAGSGTSKTSKTYMDYNMAGGKSFDWQNHEYTFTVPDDKTTFAVFATKPDTKISYVREAYTSLSSGRLTNATKASTTTAIKTSISGMVAAGGKNNSAQLTFSRTSGSGASAVTYYQNYNIKTQKKLSISSIKAADQNGQEAVLTQKENPDTTGFSTDVLDYSIKVSKKDTKADITFKFAGAGNDNTKAGQYTVELNGEKILREKGNQEETRSIALDPTKDKETVSLTVTHGDGSNISRIYNIDVEKVPPVDVKFALNAKNGNVYLTEDISGNKVWPDEQGNYSLMKDASYTYTATAYGYVGKEETFKATESGTIDIELEKAKKNEAIDTDINAEWPYFRADENNNGVIDTELPTKAEDAVLYWANKLGEGYGSGAAGCPILADGYLYAYAGTKIIKVDTMTGAIVATGDMEKSSSFAINSPAYAEGMIFVGLSNGTIQAFNAKTMESLWVYHAPLKGQPNCPITYSDGYVYTGFWNSETKSANFVCISITDEDPSKINEEKLATWIHEDAGFYWAGAYASKEFVIVGTDDAESGYTTGSGDLLSMNPATGEVIDRLADLLPGDIRSSVCYDKDTNRYYFTSKGGYFCSVAVNPDGTFDKDSVNKLYLDNYSDDKSNPPMSTSTPVIYNGRAYIGVSGTSQFGAYSGHNITVIDLNTMSIAYTVRTQGYPQTSGLITTAYDEGDGTVYVYFFDNYTPGKLRVIKDKPGQTEPDTTVKEQDAQGNEYDTAYTLFTPFGTQAQYAICSPIADEYGNIYFKNDSAQMMMLGSVITDIKVTKQPDKKGYKIGETFNPEGMVVEATYANGKTRDITKYVKFTKEALTAEDTEVDIIFDIGENMMMYQDKDGEKGVKYETPQTVVDISVVESECTEHTWNAGKVTKEATYKEEGTRHHICDVCGAEKDEIIPIKMIEDDKITVPDKPDDISKVTIGMTEKQQNEAKEILQEAVKKDATLAKEVADTRDNEGSVEIKLDVKAISKSSAGSDATNIDTALENFRNSQKINNGTILRYLDISAICIMTSKDGTTTEKKITSFPEPIKFTISVPEILWDEHMDYYVARVHNGETDMLPTVKDKENRTVSFETDRLSTYALAAVWNDNTQGGVDSSIKNNTGTPESSTASGSGSAGIKTTTINAQNTPKASFDISKNGDNNKDSRIFADWSIVNLAIALIALALCAVIYINMIREKFERMRKYVSILSIVPAIAAIFTFIITQDIGGTMGYVDKYTPLMAIILLAQFVLIFMTKTNTEVVNEDDIDFN